jgi:para-nitrobenzyl esterase
MSYWAQFAYTGDPASGRNGELLRWTAWDNASAADGKFMVFDTPAHGGVRMSSGVVTKAGVVAEIEADPRMPTPRDKCERFRDLARHSGYFTEDDYATAGSRRCAAYPIAAYPWG